MGAHVSVPMYRRSLRQRVAWEGQRCTACAAVTFPPRAACPNCRKRAFEPFTFSGEGEIHALTRIARAGAPPEFADQATRTNGYHVAIIELDEGPLITGQLIGSDREPSIGDRVHSVIRRLYDEEGVVRYGFKFTLA